MGTDQLVITNAKLPGTDDLHEIVIDDARITRISRQSERAHTGDIDADGNLVGPGFVDCHTHCNKAFAATGGDYPKHNTPPWGFDHFNTLEREYVTATPADTITDRAVKNIELGARAGTTFMRSHVVVDHDRGLKHVKSMLKARESTNHLVDLQLVPKTGGRGYADSLTDSTISLLRDAIELIQTDALIDQPVVLGGSDPALGQHDIERTLTTWFQLASEYDIPIDFHLQDGGTLGAYTIDRVLDYIADYAYENRVTVSHGYALSHIPDWWLRDRLPAYHDHGVNFVTCHQTTPPTFPLRALLEADVTVGIGTDNVRDFVFPYGNADPLEAPYILLNKLHGDMTYDEETRWFQTNPGLTALWSLITHSAADLVGKPQYGITEGAPADLIVFDEPSVHWAILNQATRRYVVKNGTVVAENGALLTE